MRKRTPILTLRLPAAPDDRRRAERLLCAEMVRVIQHGTYTGEGIVEDVSDGGCKLHLDVQLTPGQRVLIETPDDICTVLVRYCAIAEPDMFEAGVEFVRTDEAEGKRHLM